MLKILQDGSVFRFDLVVGEEQQQVPRQEEW
jgi:hypothetical protein